MKEENSMIAPAVAILGFLIGDLIYNAMFGYSLMHDIAIYLLNL